MFHALYFQPVSIYGQKRWQAKIIIGGNPVYLVVPPASDGYTQPKSDRELWLCRDFGSSKNGIVEVELTQRLMANREAEVSLRFEQEKTRLANGRPSWSYYHFVGFMQQYAENICFVPFIGGANQPEPGKEFWICRFRQVAFISRRAKYIVASVELLLEDTEARDKYLAEVRAEQERRDDALRLQAEQVRMAEARALKRRQELEARQSSRPVAIQDDGHGIDPEYLRHLEQIDKENGVLA